jgi:hypothetical protein
MLSLSSLAPTRFDDETKKLKMFGHVYAYEHVHVCNEGSALVS